MPVLLLQESLGTVDRREANMKCAQWCKASRLMCVEERMNQCCSSLFQPPRLPRRLSGPLFLDRTLRAVPSGYPHLTCSRRSHSTPMRLRLRGDPSFSALNSLIFAQRPAYSSKPFNLSPPPPQHIPEYAMICYDDGLYRLTS